MSLADAGGWGCAIDHVVGDFDVDGAFVLQAGVDDSA